MKIVAISDEEVGFLPNIIRDGDERFKDISVLLSCGDLPERYVRTVAESLSRPYFFVLGNHDLGRKKITKLNKTKNIGFKFKKCEGALFLGFYGSEKYNTTNDDNQIGQITNTIMVLWIIIKYFFLLKFIGRKKLIVISHNTPIFNKKDDKTHRGFWAYGLVIKLLTPEVWIHGHTHLKTMYIDKIVKKDKTKIINIYGYKIIDIDDEKVSIRN